MPSQRKLSLGKSKMQYRRTNMNEPQTQRATLRRAAHRRKRSSLLKKVALFVVVLITSGSLAYIVHPSVPSSPIKNVAFMLIVILMITSILALIWLVVIDA